MTRTVHRVVGILLALSFGVRADTETLVRVLATIPNEGTLQSVNTNARGDLILPGEGQVDDRPLMKDVEVIGFISQNGDFFELDKSRLLGSIEAKEDTDAGMIMCRYGNIVVYSDQNCNTFLKPSNTAAPVKTEVEQTLSKSQKKKNRRNPSRTKRKNKKSAVRRKALKKTGNTNRRRNNLSKKQKSKRRKNVRTKSKLQNRRRGNRINSKRRRVNYGDGDTRSYAQAQPLQSETLNDSR